MIPITKLSGRLGNQMFQLAYLYSQVAKHEIPDIYVQDEKYFLTAAHLVKVLYSGGISSLPINKIAIHVRRGDYVGNAFYVDLTATDYYIKAMEMFPNEEFLVFSDDINWCKAQSMFEKCSFSEETDEIEDLNRMASCKGHIIANSSYSWWGAYLSPHNGDVIAPSAINWYTDGIERTKCPEHWKRI